MPRNHEVQESTKAVARIMLETLDAMARVVHRHDQHSQYFLEAIRDELAPQLKWAARYGEWQLDAAPFVADEDTAPDWVVDPADDELEG